jgi:ClpP class serine protease
MTKGPLIHVASALRGQPWAITQPALSEMLRIADRAPVNIQALAPKMDRMQRQSRKGATALRPRAGKAPGALSRDMQRDAWDADRPYIRDGVAVIPIVGPLFAYASWLTDLCGAMSYDVIADSFFTALDNDKVKAILFSIDSPGGQVTDCSELAAMIAGARGTKPVLAYVGGACCSAAYWLASATDGIVVSSTAMLGCLGVVGTIRDTRAAEEKLGIKSYEIVSSQTPNKRPDVATDDGYSQILAEITDLADVFLNDVATYRGVTRQVVDDQYGKGAVFIGRKAVTAGLAEDVGSFEAVLESLAAA